MGGTFTQGDTEGGGSMRYYSRPGSLAHLLRTWCLVVHICRVESRQVVLVCRRVPHSPCCRGVSLTQVCKPAVYSSSRPGSLSCPTALWQAGENVSLLSSIIILTTCLLSNRQQHKGTQWSHGGQKMPAAACLNKLFKMITHVYTSTFK